MAIIRVFREDGIRLGTSLLVRNLFPITHKINRPPWEDTARTIQLQGGPSIRHVASSRSRASFNDTRKHPTDPAGPIQILPPLPVPPRVLASAPGVPAPPRANKSER